MKAIAILDFETTGIDVRQGKVIEGAVILMEVLDGPDGMRIGRELDSYAAFNDPGVPIPEEIVALTGITDEMVRGQRLDWARLSGILKQADRIVAHNARFDRGWLEAFGEYRSSSWACTYAMIEWKSRHRLPCATLKHLAWEHGYFPNAHRALDDVRTLAHLLTLKTKADPRQTYLEELLQTAAAGKRLVLARGSPFEKKDALKANLFSWAGGQKVWWRLVPEAEWERLKNWMDAEIYAGRPLYQTVENVDYLAPGFKSQYGLE